MGILKHIANVAVKPQLASLPVVLPVNQNFSLCRLEEPTGKIYKGTLSGSRLAYNCHIGTCRNLQIKVA